MYSIKIIGILGFLLAFGQLVPTIWNWWRVRRSRLQAFPVGKVELSFTGFGNAMSLEGNFRAEDRDFFVHGLSVAVLRKSDSERRDFDWAGVKFRKVVACFQPIRLPIRAHWRLTYGGLRPSIIFWYLLTSGQQRTCVSFRTSAWRSYRPNKI